MKKLENKVSALAARVERAVISLPERSKTMKALTESLKNLVGMEREAYGLDEKKPEQAPGEITITF